MKALGIILVCLNFVSFVSSCALELVGPLGASKPIDAGETSGAVALAISSSESDPTVLNTFPVQFDFSQEVTGFSIGDIAVTNGSASGFNPISALQYTVDITPTLPGLVSVDVTAGVAVNALSQGNQAASTYSVTYATCPTNYIPIPALVPYTAGSFCVAKYEMKILGDDNGNQNYNAAFVADSRASGTPWVKIGRDFSITECQDLGTGHDLITNDEWQSIARNIEAVASNWNTDSFGDVVLNHGHGDNNPAFSCDASQEYVDTDCGNSGLETDFEEKRTHTLSSGEVIWDTAGNVWEWISDTNSATVNGGSNDYVSLIPGIQNQFGPASLTCDNTASNNRCGFGRLWDDSTDWAFRGGRFANGTANGVFAIGLNRTPGTLTASDGFRCVFHP